MTRNTSQSGAERRHVHFPNKASEASAKHCISSEQFLREPSQVTEIVAKGTSVCIHAGNAKIIVGSSQRTPPTRSGWKLVQALQFKVVRIFHPARRPLDVSWLE